MHAKIMKELAQIGIVGFFLQSAMHGIVKKHMEFIGHSVRRLENHGASICVILSLHFWVEALDHTRGREPQR